MSHRSPDRMVVLHGLRVKGFADPATLVEFTGLGETEVGELLHGLACAGAAIHRLGPVPGGDSPMRAELSTPKPSPLTLLRAKRGPQ